MLIVLFIYINIYLTSYLQQHIYAFDISPDYKHFFKYRLSRYLNTIPKYVNENVHLKRTTS